MSTKTVLSLDGLGKSFGNTFAISDVYFEVASGEIFGFLGPNGAGKSTVIRLILGILFPDDGKISLFGNSDYTAPKIHCKIGYLAGDMTLDDDLTGRQYLNFVASSYGKNCDERIDELAKILQADLSKKISNYSRGNKQKIGLIAAMMHNPELLILDEPTSGFDPLIQEYFMGLIREFRDGGGAVLMSSHILGEVQQLCDRVAFIKNGKIVGISNVDDLEASASKVIRIVASPSVIKSIKKDVDSVAGLAIQTSKKENILELSYSGSSNVLIKFLTKFNIDDIRIEEPDLDNVFMTYYGEEQIL